VLYHYIVTFYDCTLYNIDGASDAADVCQEAISLSPIPQPRSVGVIWTQQRARGDRALSVTNGTDGGSTDLNSCCHADVLGGTEEVSRVVVFRH
jgi:hypothetical protein